MGFGQIQHFMHYFFSRMHYTIGRRTDGKHGKSEREGEIHNRNRIEFSSNYTHASLFAAVLLYLLPFSATKV